MPDPRRTAVLLPLALTALALGACGSSSSSITVDADTLRLTSADGQPVPVTQPRCDEVEDPEVGDPVRCTARNPAGSTLEIAGEVASIEGERARISGTVTRALAPGPTVAREVTALLQREVGRRPQGITCPAQVEIPTPRPVTCRLPASRGGAFDVSVSYDARGRASVQVADAATP